MKFLDTNLTGKEFILALKRSQENLPGVMLEWANLDEDLQQEYLQQLCWMLGKAAEHMETFYCEGCGEPRYKCWCDEECQFCGELAITCMGQSDSGYCPKDPNHDKYVEYQKVFEQAEPGNNGE